MSCSSDDISPSTRKRSDGHRSRRRALPAIVDCNEVPARLRLPESRVPGEAIPVMPSRRTIIISGLTALTLTLGACTSSGTTGSSGGGGATPHRGGTVSMLGQSDIFNLDTVSAYYTVSSMIELLFTRQLYQYRDVANFAQQTKPVPDVATGYPA